MDGSLWLGIGKWLALSVGLAGAAFGLFLSVRWVARLVGDGTGHGMPKWLRWKR